MSRSLQVLQLNSIFIKTTIKFGEHQLRGSACQGWKKLEDTLSELNEGQAANLEAGQRTPGLCSVRNW